MKRAMNKLVMMASAMMLFAGCAMTWVAGAGWKVTHFQLLEFQKIDALDVSTNHLALAGTMTDVSTQAAPIVEAVVKGIVEGLVKSGVVAAPVPGYGIDLRSPEGSANVYNLSPVRSTSTNANDRLLVIGDSWASAKRSDSGHDDGWPEILNIPAAYRQGVDGTTARDWAGDVNGMLTRALATPCEKVVISLGGNDAFAIKSNPANAKNDVCDSVAALRKVVSKFQDKVGIENTWVLLYANPWPDNPAASCGLQLLDVAIAASCPVGTQFWDLRGVLGKDDFSNGDYHPNLEGSIKEAEGIQKTAKWSAVK